MKIPKDPEDLQKRFKGFVAGTRGQGFAEIITQKKVSIGNLRSIIKTAKWRKHFDELVHQVCNIAEEDVVNALSVCLVEEVREEMKKERKKKSVKKNPKKEKKG